MPKINLLIPPVSEPRDHQPSPFFKAGPVAYKSLKPESARPLRADRFFAIENDGDLFLFNAQGPGLATEAFLDKVDPDLSMHDAEALTTKRLLEVLKSAEELKGFWTVESEGRDVIETTTLSISADHLRGLVRFVEVESGKDDPDVIFTITNVPICRAMHHKTGVNVYCYPASASRPAKPRTAETAEERPLP